MGGGQGPERAHGREPLSPELALVDPGLAAAARRKLPEPGEWRPASIPVQTPPAVGQAARTAPPLRGPPEPARRRTSASRRLLTAFAAALITPFVAASGLSLAVLAYDESEGSLLPFEAIAPNGPLERPTPTTAPADRAERSPRAKRPPDRRRAKRPRDRTKRRSRARRTLGLTQGGVVIGSWRVEERATVAAATAAFGRPTRRRGDPFYCELAWRSLGVRVTFYDMDARRPCRRGVFVRALITGRSWRTARGLRIGAPIRSIRRRHPDASRRSQAWWLLAPIRRRAFEPWRPDPGLTARVRGGRVVAFYVT